MVGEEEKNKLMFLLIEYTYDVEFHRIGQWIKLDMNEWLWVSKVG
jgi:hypothetical protein